jgi:hypothetical protein
VRLSGSRDKLEPFGISKLASRTFFADASGADASLGAGTGRRQEMPLHVPLAAGAAKRTTLSTLPVVAGAKAGETAATAKRWLKESGGRSN